MTMTAVAAGVTGCASRGPQVTTAAPPTVVCGTVLSDSAAGPVVFDATRRLPVIKYLTVGDVLMFRVVRGCDEGAHVSWVPSAAAQLVKVAHAVDGLTAAVVLQPSVPRASFRLTGTRNGRVVASITVKLASWACGSLQRRASRDMRGMILNEAEDGHAEGPGKSSGGQRIT
jgi:hypothetical protein